MKTFQLSCVIAWAAMALATNVAQAFSISSVTVSPNNLAPPPGNTMKMTVNITTPSLPAYVYAPSQITSNASGLHVDIFPSSGAITTIGSLRETLQLGQFAPGTYSYEVVIHPDYQVNWGVRTNHGTFSVPSAHYPGATNYPPYVYIVSPTNNQS